MACSSLRNSFQEPASRLSGCHFERSSKNRADLPKPKFGTAVTTHKAPASTDAPRLLSQTSLHTSPSYLLPSPPNSSPQTQMPKAWFYSPTDQAVPTLRSGKGRSGILPYSADRSEAGTPGGMVRYIF